MKTMKKVGAIVLALCMCMSLCVTAFASSTSDAEDGFSITISNSKTGQTYSVYKIFDVTYSDEDEDGNVNYSYTITDNSAWYALFTTGMTGYTCPFEFTATTGAAEEDVTVYNVTIGTDESTGAAYTDADIIAYLEAAIAQVGGGEGGEWNIPEAYGPVATGEGNGGEIVIKLDEPGYYFVTTTTGSVVSITTTDPNANIIDKNTTWDLKKEIVNGLEIGDDMHEDAEAMGDDVEFTITATVPLYAAYDPDQADAGLPASPEGYLVTDYEFTDTMAHGLEIRGLAIGIDYTYDSATDTYWATSTLIDTWVTIDGEPISTYAYNVKLQLIPDTDASGNLVYDENGQVQFRGFTLTYDTLPYAEDGKLYYEGSEVTSSTFADAAELVEALGVKYPANASIEIDYTAHVTDEADYDNTNEIEMAWHATTYRQPNPNEPEYGGTEYDKNDIYVLDIEIDKVDGADGTTGLAGAEFKLEGTNLKDVVTSESVSYTALESMTDYETALANGETLYFLLKSGEHTAVNPYTLAEDDSRLDNYVVNPYWNITATDPSTGQLVDDYYRVGDYKYVAYTKTVTDDYGLEESGDDMYVTGVTGTDGTLHFTGLTVGNWVLTEITAPDGYNLLTDPIEFTIGVTWNTDGTPSWTINVTSGTNAAFTAVVDEETEAFTGSWSITIENNAGTILPGTGGMGTTIFYIVGAILICGAVVVLVTRRRVNRAA